MFGSLGLNVWLLYVLGLMEFQVASVAPVCMIDFGAPLVPSMELCYLDSGIVSHVLHWFEVEAIDLNETTGHCPYEICGMKFRDAVLD
ncbi:hypothetical protein V6N11_046940 [Hibiscus sabdariffa]|uniref:Secreted protein n=1 Tax=Hibiscus sabdariffa TaxID=183260 RepID=A0ABR2ND81_9ROSI